MPTPLRPTSPTFSPRPTSALNSGITVCPPKPFVTPLISMAILPDGRFMVKRMYGRAMFDRASAVVSRRSTSFRRDVAWLARVPDPKRAMKSLSCAIFFSRCA